MAGREFSVSSASSGRSRLRTGLLAGTAAAAALLPVSLANATSAGPTVPHDYAISLFASAPSGDSSPDDICRLGDEVFVGYQNGVGPNGEPNASGGSASTIVEDNPDGSVANQWSVTGKGRRPRLRPRPPSRDRDRQRGLELLAGHDHAVGAAVGPTGGLSLLAEPESGKRLRPAAGRRGGRPGA